MKIIVYNGYPLSVFVAVSMHIAVLAALLYLRADRSVDITDMMPSPTIKALFVNENPQIRNERLLEEQRLIRLDQERRAQEEANRRAEDERRQQEEAEAEARRQQEIAAQEQRQREANEQRESEEQARREAEIARQQEQERQRELEQQREQEIEAQRQREIAAEQERQRQAESVAAAAAADIARTEFEMIQAYTGVIHDLVQQNWSRPPSARNGMTAVFRIQIVPTGDILDVSIVQSSGDAAFDRSAESAIYRVGRFTELQGMPIRMFNDNFRSLLLTFRPEDLLN